MIFFTTCMLLSFTISAQDSRISNQISLEEFITPQMIQSNFTILTLIANDDQKFTIESNQNDATIPLSKTPANEPGPKRDLTVPLSVGISLGFAALVCIGFIYSRYYRRQPSQQENLQKGRRDAPIEINAESQNSPINDLLEDGTQRNIDSFQSGSSDYHSNDDDRVSYSPFKNRMTIVPSQFFENKRTSRKSMDSDVSVEISQKSKNRMTVMPSKLNVARMSYRESMGSDISEIVPFTAAPTEVWFFNEPASSPHGAGLRINTARRLSKQVEGENMHIFSPNSTNVTLHFNESKSAVEHIGDETHLAIPDSSNMFVINIENINGDSPIVISTEDSEKIGVIQPGMSSSHVVNVKQPIFINGESSSEITILKST